MPQLIDMIQAYGASMANGDASAAHRRLKVIEAALAGNDDEAFEEFWNKVPAPLVKAGPMTELGVRQVCEIAWFKGRQSLRRGSDYKD